MNTRYRTLTILGFALCLPAHPLLGGVVTGGLHFEWDAAQEIPSGSRWAGGPGKQIHIS